MLQTTQPKLPRPTDPVEQPIINSPYEEPKWHWTLDERQVAQAPLKPGRREARGGSNPVPQPKITKTQPMFDNSQEELILVNNLRTLVARWRQQGYPGVTNATKRLLDHWNSDQPEPRLFFAQREAIETLIYLYEITSPSSEPWEALNKENQAYNEGIRRLAIKMATGTGKTAVMALIIIWQSVNHAQSPRDRRFTNQFAIITPGITVRDRNRQDLIPNREPNIYTGWNLVPPRSAYLRAVENAKVSITNFHSLQLREISWGQASSRAKNIARMRVPTENGREMIKRALENLDPRGRIMVLNDEGHHCHNTKSQLIEVQAEDRKTADLWFNGIREINDTGRMHTAIDLSATPLFITRHRTKTNDQVFPWTVSDFPLTDAIESGMVKIPRIPVEDDASTGGYPVYRNLYAQSAGKTKQDRRELTEPLASALNTMYGNYLETARGWEKSKTPPVFIIVANNVPNSQAIFEYVSGYRPNESRPWEPGQLDEFSNVDPSTMNLRTPPRTILIHSKLDQEDKISGNYSKTLFQQSQAFRRAMPQHPWPKDDKDVMREVLNTVGKEGQPGEQVRCVVSIAMLTEGWDTRNVTHVVGFRRFGTHLLCEQVAGRSLRRIVYDRTDDQGFFEPEYADIMGIPFEFTFKPKNGKPKPPVETYEVKPLVERGEYRIRWPNVIGYERGHNGNGELDIDWDKFSQIQVTAGIPEITELRSSIGEPQIMETEHKRGHTAVFRLANELTSVIEKESKDIIHRTELFRSALAIVREGLTRNKIATHGHDWVIGEADHRRRIARQLAQACRSGNGKKERAIQPILDAPICYTTREIAPYPSSRHDWIHTQKSQMNIAPCDNRWELQVAKVLDDHPRVKAWVRNDRQRWHIPYMMDGEWANYEPDFIARVETQTGPLNLVIEVKGQERERDLEKKKWAEEFWKPAVNGRPELTEQGEWDYLYIEDPAMAHMMISEITGGTQW